MCCSSAGQSLGALKNRDLISVLIGNDYFTRNCPIAATALAAPTLAMSSSSCGVLPLTPIAPITLPSIQWEYRLATALHLAGPAQLRAHHGPDLQTPCLNGGKSRPCVLCRSRL